MHLSTYLRSIQGQLRNPRMLEILCLWGVLAGVGVYLANAMAAGL